MSPKGLKIALAMSVALNLFAAAALVTVTVGRDRVEQRVEAQRKPGREGSFKAMLSGLDADVRDQVRARLRESALAARPDFDAARAARRQAIDLAGQPTFDPAAVKTLLEQSRAAELRGRARLEDNAVAVLSDLEADDRKALSVILARHGPRGPRTRDRDDAPPEARRETPAN